MTGRRIKSAVTNQREPVVDAIEEQHVRQEVAAQEFASNHQLNVAAQKAGLGPSSMLALLEHLTPDARRRIMGDTTRVENFAEHTEQGLWDGDAPVIDISGTIFRSRDRQALQDQADRHERRMFTYLYDPPIGGVHRGMTRCHINMAKYLMTEQRFTAQQIAPMWEPGEIDCGYVAIDGTACDKTGFHTEDEREAHQRTKHRDYVNRREYARIRETQELDLAIKQQQLQLQQASLAEMREQRAFNRAVLAKLGITADDFADPAMATAIGG